MRLVCCLRDLERYDLERYGCNPGRLGRLSDPRGGLERYSFRGVSLPSPAEMAETVGASYVTNFWRLGTLRSGTLRVYVRGGLVGYGTL